MVFEGSATALSHTGKVRSNNQDSGYAGSNLYVVADGMGGHAGGDVASSIAIRKTLPQACTLLRPIAKSRTSLRRCMCSNRRGLPSVLMRKC